VTLPRARNFCHRNPFPWSLLCDKLPYLVAAPESRSGTARSAYAKMMPPSIITAWPVM
jgi:hypothetical protein